MTVAGPGRMVAGRNGHQAIADKQAGWAKKAVGRAGNQGYQRAQTGVGNDFNICPTGRNRGLHLDTVTPLRCWAAGRLMI